MSTPYFQSPSRQSALIAELESWRDTPFVKFGSPGAKKGYRSNCVTFIEGVLANLGAIQSVEWPLYVVSGGGATMFNLVLASLQGSGLSKIWERPGTMPTPILGDVIFVSTGTKLHHLAIFAGDNTVWHSTELGRGVCTGNVNDPLITRFAHSLWRAME